jgi:hypothetical protein
VDGSNPKGSADGGADDAGSDAEWDGWSGAFASGSTSPPPACSSPALSCSDAFPGQTPFASAQEAADALVGQWSFCGQTSDFYPPGQLGEEYAADSTYYALIQGPNGTLVRNLDPTAISVWQVDLAPNGGIEVHTFGGGVQRGGGLSACPPSLVLLSVEARL